MNFSTLKVMIAVLLATAFSSACSFRQTTPEIDIYTLMTTDQRTVQPSASSSGYSLELARIDSPASLASNKIFYRQQHGLESYAYSRWSDALPQLLRRCFQRHLQQRNGLAVVVSENSQAKADWILETNLYDFSHHILASKQSEVRVLAQFYIIDSHSRQVVATTELESNIEVAEQNAKVAVVAFQQATDQISQQLAVWLEHNLPK